MSLITRSGQSISRNWEKVVGHLFFFGGLGLVTYGAGLIHPAGRYLVGGAALYWIAILMQNQAPRA